MAQHPFQPLNPTLRIPPAHARSHSRSSSRSPERRSLFFTHELDPLLNNLSPRSTLEALSATDSVPTDEKTAKDLLAKSIAEVSTTERALGIRAAVAAKKLREWHLEITSWDWPIGKDVTLGKGFIPPIKDADTTTGKLGESPSGTRDYFLDDYLGSLPVSLVEFYSSRIDEIKDDMDALDVDELKEHVLNAHMQSRSRPSSSNGDVCTAPQRLSYVQLSDFTAVVTATILQALPWLSRLNTLLDTWDVILIVLWQIPGLLENLKTTRTALDAAMASLESQTPPSENDALYSQSSFRATRQNLEYLVVSACSKVDRILDLLEGREDTLPDAWIDDLDSIEADFGNWVVEAEKLAIRNEWSRLNNQPNDIQPAPEVEAEVTSLEGQTEVEKTTTHQPTKGISSSNPPNETDINDEEYIQSTDSNSSSVADPNLSSVSGASITGENPKSEPSAQSRVENVDVQFVHDSSLSPVNVKTSSEAPEEPKTTLHSPPVMPVDSKSGSSEIQSTVASITESGPQYPQPSKLDKSSEIIREYSNSNSFDETNQLDGKLIENEGRHVDSAAGSSYTKSNLTHVPSSDEDAHCEVLLDKTTSTPVDSSAQPSPEINVTSPAQSDEEISPRNTSFGGRRDSSSSPTDAVGSTASAAPFPFKHDSQTPPKKIKHKPGPLDIAAITAKSHRRSVSGDSLASDCMSEASSPEIKDALTATSHGSPMVVEATSPWTQSKYSLAKPSRTYSAQTVNGPRFHGGTTEPPSPNESLELHKTASLPLERFFDDHHGPDRDDCYKAITPAEIKRASVTSIEVRPKTEVIISCLTFLAHKSF